MTVVGAEGSGDTYRGDEAVASNRPGRDDRVFKEAWRRRFGRRVASMCQTTSDRWARAEVRRLTGGTQWLNSFPV
jgi:hypothetical protein